MQEINFEEVLEANKDKIVRLCRVYAVAPIDAQDLFQEVAFQLWKSLQTFRGEASISTWVYRVALNVCMRSKLHYKRTNDKRVSLALVEFHLTLTEDSNNEQKLQWLQDCIRALSDSDSSIVLLYLEDLSYREIADITGLTENHIAVKMKRIRQRLLNCITPKMQNYER